MWKYLMKQAKKSSKITNTTRQVHTFNEKKQHPTRVSGCWLLWFWGRLCASLVFTSR